ncbi:MAG: nitroreductase family protein [Steroidobacteraceae bacterium]
MVKGSSVRQAHHPIDPLFVDRWSPRAMSGEAVSEQELMTLFEAARWAPSSMNFQPWRILYARRDSAHWPTYLHLLFDANRLWGQKAGAIALFVSKTVMDDGRPFPTHSYDTGAAWQNLALQSSLMGLAVHGIAGFDHARAREELGIPAEFAVEAMALIGRPGLKSDLPQNFQARESPNDRRPLAASVCEGRYSL